jgi:hypothetical protein
MFWLCRHDSSVPFLYGRPPSGSSNSFKIIRSQSVTFLPTASARNPFRIHTSELSCKCGKQKTYRIAKSFRFHTCKKGGGRGPRLSNSDPLFSIADLPIRISHPLFPFFSYSSALFCTHQKLNSILFNQFRTLSQKHRGWGYPLPRAALAKDLPRVFFARGLSLPLLSSRLADREAP